MNFFGCNCKLDCTAEAVIVAAVLGVLAAFAQITGVIVLAPVFLAVAFAIAVVYLAVVLVAMALAQRRRGCCACRPLRAVLSGILGTILLALVLLAVGIVATSVVSAILVGLLVFFFALVFIGTVCLVKCLGDCEEEA